MHVFITYLKDQNPDLKYSEIYGLLHILIKNNGIENNELIRQTGIVKEVLKQFKASISKYLDDSDKNRILLTQEGCDLINDINPAPHLWSLVTTDTNNLSNELEALRSKFSLLQEVAQRDYDQFFSTPASSLSKILLLKAKGLDREAKIASIGDDDLLTACLHLAEADYKLFKVFEIDLDLISKIQQIINHLNIKNAQIANYDVRNSLPKSDLGKYDVVFIDPPYTKEGVQLFLHRAIELLKTPKDYSGSYIFLNFGAGRKNPEKVLKVQEVIQQFNLVIEDKIDNFTHYFGAETVGSSSSMYILKTTPFTSVDSSVLSESIYTYQSEPEEQFPYVDHFVLKLKKVPNEILLSKNILLKTLGAICNTHRLKVIDSKITKFKNKGLTITFVLASSNLVVHTWPEHNALHIDLITCSPIYNKHQLAQTFSKSFNTNSVYIQKIS